MAAKKTKLNKKTWIYAIISSGEIKYIGCSHNVEQRFDSHRKNIIAKKHKVKDLNTVSIDNVEFKIMCEFDTDNSFATMMCESCMNSIYKPKNRIIWQAGRNIVSFARIPKDLAEAILELVVKYYNGKRYDIS